MRLAWATDIHLNFLDEPARARFHEAIAATSADVVLVGGDIGESHDVESLLVALADALARPVYFVLGNHDFYGGSIHEVRARMEVLSGRHRWLRWLPVSGIVPLTAETALVGHDGWSDGRLGNYAKSTVVLNDYIRISELAWLSAEDRLAKLNALGDEAAAHFTREVPPALERFRRVVVLTHVPPFREACWHEGKISSDDFLPHFSSKASGLPLLEAARAHADRELLVLCGHTHGEGEAQMLPNLLVRTGGAEYGAPRVATIEVG